MSLPELKKPEKRDHVFAYDYHECRDYLQQRDGYEERDYAGKYAGSEWRTLPYQDFWHFVLRCDDSIQNGSTFTMSEAWREGAEPWQQIILDKYLSAFGDTDPQSGERYVEFHVWW